MIRPLSRTIEPTIAVTVHPATRLTARLPALAQFAHADHPTPLSQHPGWLTVLRNALGHEVYALEATIGGQTCGLLPLALVSSLLFGRFLVSLPYLNSNGVVSGSAEVRTLLVNRAVELADELNVKYLELRHEEALDHPALTITLTSKVHMRLPLPETTAQLWKGFDPKVRNQIRKGEKNSLTVAWGGAEQLEPFYAVLSRNMRDLGTPVYGRPLFQEIIRTFPDHAEFCVVRAGEQPIAAALLMHGDGVTEVPTASSLWEFNSTCANMLMYRHLVDRAIERGQKIFDFGRSTIDGNTYRFKKQWGAQPHPAAWQYYPRRGDVREMRPENPRYQRLIRLWQRLPVRLTQFIGPAIVSGIP